MLFKSCRHKTREKIIDKRKETKIIPPPQKEKGVKKRGNVRPTFSLSPSWC